jgi:hypothetical protein
MSRFIPLFVFASCITAFGLASSLASDQESEAVRPGTSDVTSLIKQLDSEDFVARQEASQRLAAAGEAAIPAVEKAVRSDSREVSTRAFDILKAHHDKGTPAVKEAADQALDRLAKADLGSISRRASEILTAPKTAATPNAAPRILPGGIVPAPGGVRIAVGRIAMAAGGAGGGVETHIKIENGVKTTEIKDKDRKVKIVDDPDKGLQLEVTETKEGKEETKTYEAKDAEELKKKDDAAHKIYEQYRQKGAEIKFGGAIGGAIPFAPAVPIAPRRLMPAVPAIPVVPGAPVPAIAPPLVPIPEAAPPAATRQQLESLEALERSLQEAEASLKEIKDNEQVAKARTRLEEARKQLEQLRSALK